MTRSTRKANTPQVTTRTKKSGRSRSNSPRSNAPRSNQPQLRITYAEANRVRKLLLSEEVQVLEKRDVRTLLRILDDVYPVRSRRRSAWQPLLIGMVIGLLVLGIMML